MEKASRQLITVDCVEPTRINKYLAHRGIRSRREVDALVADRKIIFNGQVLESQGQKVQKGDVLEIIEDFLPPVTITLNKPPGYVSDIFSSKAHPFAIELLPKDFRHLSVVGRLDVPSRGLLIFSSDGVLVKRLIGESSEIEKEYQVQVEGRIAPGKLDRLRFGISLDGEKLKPARVEQTGPQSLTIVLKQGKNRQIRRMCEKVELDVIDLVRVRIGGVSLGDLKEGSWKEISDSSKFLQGRL